MPEISKQEIKLFYCYAHEDKTLRDELEKHLSGIKRTYSLRNWHDREILPGTDWEHAINDNLDTAHLILLLVSSDFIHSEYCYSKEMQRAIKRHKEGTCRVIPIILRPTDWEGTPFSELQMLPTDAIPITRWTDREEAFQDVVKGIKRVLNDLLISLKMPKDWLDEGISYRNLKLYDDALAAIEQALSRDPNYLEAYQQKGMTLLELEHYDDALEAFEQALHLNPNLVTLYIAKGRTLDALERYEEALTVFEQAIHLDPNLADGYIGRDRVLQRLGISREAQKRLEDQLQETQQQLADQQKQTGELESKLEQAYQHRDYVLGQLGIAKEVQEQIANQLEQAQQQLVDQREQSIQFESQLQHTRQQLIDQRKRSEEFESQWEQVQRQRDEAFQQLAIVKVAQKQLASQLQHTQQQLTDQQKRVKQRESQLEQMEQQKDEAFQQLATAKKEQEQLESQLQQTQQQLTDQQKRAGQLESQLELARAQKEKALRQVTNLQEQLASSREVPGGTDGDQAPPRRVVGDNIEQPVEVTLQEAYVGGVRTFNIQSMDACLVCHRKGEISGKPCTNCKGQGTVVTGTKRLQVKIPPGVYNGSKIRIAGEGLSRVSGGPRGDLRLVITVKPDPLYERKGDDLYTNVDVDLITAMLGGEVQVPTPDGRRLLLTIPPETQNGRKFRLAEIGIPHLRDEDRGDLFACIKIILPMSLTDEERALFEKLAHSRSIRVA